MTEVWGYHLILDLTKCNPYTIRDAVKIADYIDQVCDLLKVTRFGPPNIVWFGSGPVAGYTFTQLIETSLVSGHFAEQSESAFIDIFSCKAFDVDKVTAFTQDFFEAELLQSQFLKRGSFDEV